jgi:hypothetical protein
MRKHRSLRWCGLFALFPLAIGLIVLDNDARLPETWHLVLLSAIAMLICGLALIWSERNSELIEREGVDARVTYRLFSGSAGTWRTLPASSEPNRAEAPVRRLSYDPLSAQPVDDSKPAEQRRPLQGPSPLPRA